MAEDHQRGHRVTDRKDPLIWMTQYRLPVLKGDGAIRCRDLRRKVCQAREVNIVRGAVSPDDPYSAMMESFWATLKDECFADERPATRQAAKLQLLDYIEGFYHRTRLHSSLGYQSPLAFEANLSYSRN